jgi:hypothetical protein
MENCRCGIYAFNSLLCLFMEFDLFIEGWMPTVEPDTRSDCGIVLGRVQLAGKIIEHEFGYRAERARIAELLPLHGIERSVIRLAARLGLTIGRPVASPIIWEPLMRPPGLSPRDPPPTSPSSPARRVKDWVRPEAGVAPG